MAKMHFRARVLKWGKSMAIRVPTEVVEALALQEGNQIEISVRVRDKTVSNAEQERAIARLKALRKSSPPLPPGFRFDRDEAHER
jgi:antitoxin MazE